MAFVTMDGFDVEHASSLLIYENLMGEIQHINGKGVTDKYTTRKDVENVTYIDVMRVLPNPPRFRQLGALNNGKFHNAKNDGYSNAPQSTHYTINVDLIYDEGVPITLNQIMSNRADFKSVVLAQIVKTAGMTINIVTYAKQIAGFFRNGDNFDKALTHDTANLVAADVTAGEIANAVFAYDPAVTGLSAGSPTLAVQKANAKLDNGIPELGAFVVPREGRQGFISSDLNVLIKGQYAQNASEAAAKILYTGFINPFNNNPEQRINENTGLLGGYDGVDLFLFNDVTRKFVYVALGLLGTADDTTVATERALLDKMQGMIVYGAGTCRGIVGPSVEANPNPYYGGIYILPKLKVGVDVLHGASIKMIIDAGTSLSNTWTAANIVALMKAIKFTPIDGSVVTGSVVGGFNDGTTS